MDTTQAALDRTTKPAVLSRAAAFTELYESTARRLFAFLRFRLGDAELAEELTAETFARAWDRLKDWRDADSAKAWLFRTARNLSHDQYRRHDRAVWLEALVESIESDSRSLEDLAIRRELFQALARSLHVLGDRDRAVIELRYVAGLRNQEIARAIGTSDGNVAKIVHRSLRKLRVELSGSGMPIQEGERE
jgi:RNA polymerase sigma-70 factor (ECF subfamily)